jgi:branched-chain amino acid aminotransferase
VIGDWVYINGEFCPQNEAKVSVFDRSFVYGDGVFEGLQAVNGGVFKLKEHIDRLYRSAHYLGFEIPIGKTAMIDAVLETGRRNGLRDGYLRPIVSRGVGPIGVRHTEKLGPGNVVIVAQHEKVEDRSHLFARGERAHVASLRRVPPDCLDSRAKTCNYINNILAFLEARRAGCDTAIMLDMQGYVAEGYGSNVFSVRDGTVETPPTGNILEGITRATVIELCGEMGIPSRERPMTVYDLVTADEVFESASMAELVPIVDVGGRSVNGGEVGPMVGRLHAALRERMSSLRDSALIFNN